MAQLRRALPSTAARLERHQSQTPAGAASTPGTMYLPQCQLRCTVYRVRTVSRCRWLSIYLDPAVFIRRCVSASTAGRPGPKPLKRGCRLRSMNLDTTLLFDRCFLAYAFCSLATLNLVQFPAKPRLAGSRTRPLPPMNMIHHHTQRPCGVSIFVPHGRAIPCNVFTTTVRCRPVAPAATVA